MALDILTQNGSKKYQAKKKFYESILFLFHLPVTFLGLLGLLRSCKEKEQQD